MMEMVTEEQIANRLVICLSNVHVSDMWTQHMSYFSQQQHGMDACSSGNRDEEFVFHLLDIHARFCVKSSCRTRDVALKSNMAQEGDSEGWVSGEETPDMSCDHDIAIASMKIKTENVDEEEDVGRDCGIAYQPNDITGSSDVSHEHTTNRIAREIKIEIEDETTEGSIVQSWEEGELKIEIREVATLREDSAQYSAAKRVNASCTRLSENSDIQECEEYDIGCVCDGNHHLHCESTRDNGNTSDISLREDSVDEPSETTLISRSGKKLYKCKRCPKMFPRSYLKVHDRTHTGDRPYKCDLCSKAYSENSKLQRHLRAHTGERPFKCNLCTKAFIRNDDLRGHMRLHTGEKPYKCNHCSMAFAKNRDLQRHMRTHTGERPFKCNLCTKAFNQKGHLDSHMRTHSGERPYPCNICGKTFAKKQNLTPHMRIHTGEKPYKCNICSKAFTEKQQMKVHMKFHIGVRPYECSVCLKAFFQKVDLTRHMKTHKK